MGGEVRRVHLSAAPQEYASSSVSAPLNSLALYLDESGEGVSAQSECQAAESEPAEACAARLCVARGVAPLSFRKTHSGAQGKDGGSREEALTTPRGMARATHPAGTKPWQVSPVSANQATRRESTFSIASPRRQQQHQQQQAQQQKQQKEQPQDVQAKSRNFQEEKALEVCSLHVLYFFHSCYTRNALAISHGRHARTHAHTHTHTHTHTVWL